ncbi:hypothetical protein PPL_10883 [Heterostelium album PN500]|uniref:Uncharacterized protein n=1 Tax=Heterostelium pallidum (strain ATCC 26659 / Pp 5 / PN500) TaxID=670386 RepID=D3BS91_HETP5|nr:hypothetical protein PPL_10883 [Heterostelium album PN500]EFA75828.1 hypothetical protein PPL_10883 [Heterostelium album PN500]|eukprot:XP_020427962.1 hypothetical protein PPL_10883 [Heterostelium album PN500]
MKISVKNLSFKTLFMVGLLVITLDKNNFVKAQDGSGSDSNSLENPKYTYCLGTTFETCVTAGACCAWCSDLNITSQDSAYKSSGVCVYNDGINTAGECPLPPTTPTTADPWFKSVCPATHRVSATCTCSPPLFSNDSIQSTPSFFITFFLAVLAFLFNMPLKDTLNYRTSHKTEKTN